MFLLPGSPDVSPGNTGIDEKTDIEDLVLTRLAAVPSDRDARPCGSLGGSWWGWTSSWLSSCALAGLANPELEFADAALAGGYGCRWWIAVSSSLPA